MSTKRKAPSAGGSHKIVTPVVKPAAYKPSNAAVDESRATVSVPSKGKKSKNTGLITNFEPVIVSSDPESEDSLDDEDLSDEDGDEAQEKSEAQQGTAAYTNGITEQTKADADPDPTSLLTPKEPNNLEERARSESPSPPTFGDLVRAASPAAIDVAAVLAQQLTPAPEGATGAGTDAHGATGRTPSAVVPVTTNTLTSVLTQALHTNDSALLESCFCINELSAVRNTIERLESKYAISLLTKLASRLHRRPGRAGNLMIWVQWSLITHGGALAGNPTALNELTTLHRVLEERSRGLSSLLVLKGKLDLLDGQMQMRKDRRRRGDPPAKSSDEDEEDVIWVEGEDKKRKQPNGIGKMIEAKRVRSDVDSDSDSPAMNGVMGDTDASEEESDDASEPSDEEAADESSDDEVDLDDIEEEEEEDSDVEAPPAKVQKISTQFSKKR